MRIVRLPQIFLSDPDFTNAGFWYVCLAPDACRASRSLLQNPRRVTRSVTTGSMTKERIMAKGNNSQKNDKKDKKVKKDAKKTEVKK